jgi:uncharacterized surface protein with fasciclin (FAS1) repeats
MKTIFKRLVISSFVLLFGVATYSNIINAQGNTQTQVEGETVVDKVESNEKTSDFAELLEASGFAKVLQNEGPFTVLAPSNEALQSGVTNLEEVKENPAQVQKLVRSHLYQGQVSSSQVESDMGVGIEETDESAANGTVYIVDNIVQ